MSVMTQNLRAVIWPLLNPDTGLLCMDRFAWGDMERAPGVYDFEAVHAAIRRAKNIKRYAMMEIGTQAPGWTQDRMDGFIRMIGALGSALEGERTVLGVVVSCPEEAACTPAQLARAAEAFRLAFPCARLFVRAGGAFDGLIPGAGRMVTQEQLAAYPDVWKDAPLCMEVDPADAQQIEAAIAGHVSILAAKTTAGCNEATHAGYRFQVRRIEVDEGEKADGNILVKVEFANAGSLPCYSEAGFMFRLNGSDVNDYREYPLPLRASELMPGGTKTVSSRLDVSGLTPGEYDVHVGMFFDGTGYPASFGIEGRISDGYYEGRLILCL